MINSTDQMYEDDETMTISSTGMMTPTKTTICQSPGQELQNPTIMILVSVRNQKGHVRKDVQVKMRRSMAFRELVTLLKTRFDQSENFGLEIELASQRITMPEYAHVFDSDTPASLKLGDRRNFVFRKPDFEAIDMSKI
ncbi:hypothetical protein KCU95_g262, partial [Aureobasidium melanogenum]